MSTIAELMTRLGLDESDKNRVMARGSIDALDKPPMATTAETAPDPWQTDRLGRWVKVGAAWGWLDEEQNAVRIVSGVTVEGYRTFDFIESPRALGIITGCSDCPGKPA